RAAESLPVLVHGGDEDVLHLQIASRMQQRDRVDEALHGTARDVEPHVGGRGREQLVEGVTVEPRRQRYVGRTLETPQPFLETETIPGGSPEGDSTLAIPEEIGARLEQAGDGRAQLGWTDSVSRRDRARGGRREGSARLPEIELAVAPNELVHRQVVVHVRQVDVEDLVAEERQRAQRVERVGRYHTDH